ncbi:MAG: CoA transferase [Dehalococcoidia bacterium]|mgnify:CR=1 FL=1|jgi:crotonobetainyl-CoA:carnitine CoA-transferase CaiB-like acyl-CoA transferase|nr:CoA transferase [Dehalococcoidia bacterium]MDW8009290.1 CoA transferase [Chloroflexota bacterium]
MEQALSGIKVLDLTIWQQGPMSTALLADFGADVIKVEAPDRVDPGRSLVRYAPRPDAPNAYFETHNRNKRAVVLDLRQEKGRQVFYRLAERADVVVQNFRPGVAQRLGIDYEALRAINPRLIYACASGFGLKGPHASLPALDPLAQARGGIMSVTGEPDSPPSRTVNGLVDQVGAFLLALGVMVALYHRERTGEGQMVDGSLLQAALAVQAWNINTYLLTSTYAGQPVPRLPRRLTSPLWNHYRCADNRWIMLAMAQVGRYWPRFRQLMHEATGVLLSPEELTVDWMRFHPTELMGLIDQLDQLFATRPAAEWVELMRQNDLVCDVVQDYSEVVEDPQVLANGMIIEVQHPSYGPIRMVHSGVNLSRTPATFRRPAPEFGQHTEEVLLEFGFTWEEIEALKREGVVGPRAER